MQKLAIITGGNAGLGFRTAERALAEGYSVCLASRSVEKAEIAKKSLQAQFPNSQISIGLLDLSDLNSVREFCSGFSGRWDVLINNAGAKIEKPFKQTSQGFEWHVGVNHLGHFALTAGLLPTANQNARVVTVSSIVARRGFLDFGKHFKIRDFDERQAYANSKLMNQIFAKELARRFVGNGMSSMAAHPGFARASAYSSVAVRAAEYLLAQSAKLGSDSIWQAAKAKNGDYLAPRHFELWGKAATAKPRSISQKEVQEFWVASEIATGMKFEI